MLELLDVAQAPLAMSLLAAASAAMLAVVAARMPTAMHLIEEAVLERLPQTQCGYCGHAGCAPYAAAIVSGEPINRCPPGGERTIAELALLLDRPRVGLDPAQTAQERRAVAYIREQECIGCTICIQACPVDAILGAPKLMHTVIASECTGCDLCVDPCPVDCIDMHQLPTEVTIATRQGEALACIGCGWCEPVCPRALLPRRLLHHARMENLQALLREGIQACIECGACEHVCPADVPLLERFRSAGSGVRELQQARARAAHYRRRHEARRDRLDVERQPRTSVRSVPVEARARSVDERKRTVEEAIARVRAKKLDGAGAAGPAVEQAIERARQGALQRSAREATRRLGTEPTTADLRRRMSVTERKMERARQKLDTAEASGDIELAQLMLRSLRQHEARRNELRARIGASVDKERNP